ncbi:MAG: hypothetical protein HC882_01355 [Acidobacteria bacterium]|nr:hypothetical protein [Acidobacteriota bacterium]
MVIPPIPTPSDEMIFISPSQATLFTECQRKWAFRYLEKVEAPQNAYAALGERVHKVLEDWLLFATPPDTYETFQVEDKGRVSTHYPGRIAYAGMHHLPRPGTPMDVEFAFRLKGWTGKIDLGYEKQHDDHGRVHVVHDHKTTTNLNYAKTPDDLKSDAQGLIYAFVALEASGAPHVLDQWVYYQTREPYKSLKTELLMTRTLCEDGMVFWEDQASMIRSLRRQKPRAMDLEPSPEMCDRYGGCPYRDSGHCQLTDGERVKGYFMAEMNIEEKIAKMRAQQAQGGTGIQISPPAHIPLPQLPQIPQAAQTVPQIPQVTQSPPAAQTPQVQAPPIVPIQATASPSPASALSPEVIERMVADLRPGMFFISVLPEVVERAKSRGLGFAPEAGAFKVVVTDVVQNRAGAINPPEQPTAAVLNPEGQASRTSTGETDQFEAMDKHDLEKFIAEHRLAVEIKKGQQAKTLRKVVRAAWKDRQTALANPGLVEAPKPQAAPLPQPTDVPKIHSGGGMSIPQAPAAPPPVPAPSIPEAVQRHAERQMSIEEQIARTPLPEYVQPSGAYTQAMTEQFSIEQQQTARSSMRLFIDCMPLGDNPQSAREAFSEVFDALHQSQSVPDYRMVEYGKGPGMLVAGIRHYLETVHLDHGNVFISMSSPEGQLLRDVLVEHAGEVYIGVR